MNWFSTIRSRIHNAHPDHYAIARGMVWVALFVFLGAIARAAREVAIAYRYGVSAEVDAYLFVFNLVNWPIGVWFSLLTVVLVPLATQIQHDSSAALPRFRAELLGLTVLFGLFLGFLTWAVLPMLLQSSWTGLPPTTAAIAANMAPALALLVPLGLLISLLSAWMLTAGRHANTLLESVPALVMVMALLVFSGGGAEPLVWGTLAGFVFHLFSLAASLFQRGEIEAPRFTRHSTAWPAFWQGFGVMLIGQALMSLTNIVDQFFAAHLGTGAVATLGYANRILALLLGMGAMAVSRATLPVFSLAQAQGGEQLRHVVTHWVRILFVLGVVAMIVSWGLAPWGVKLLFERGAFTAADTAAVLEVFRFGVAQLPFYFAGLVFVSYLSSRSLYSWLLWSGVLGLCSKLIGNVLFVPACGVGGLTLATAVMYATNFVFFWWVFQRLVSNHRTGGSLMEVNKVEDSRDGKTDR